MDASRSATSSRAVTVEPRQHPGEAYEFLTEAIDYSVNRVHGAPPDGWREVVQWMHRHRLDLDALRRRYAARRMPSEIRLRLKQLGGPDALESRHISGKQLCWGFRDLAWKKWGRLALMVLREWNITSTRDIGEIVFALVAAGLLHKRPQDCLQDFDNVYDFVDAFERSYSIQLPRRLKD